MNLQSYILERYNHYLPYRLKSLIRDFKLSAIKIVIEESKAFHNPLPPNSILIGIGRKTGNLNAIDGLNGIRYFYADECWKKSNDFLFERHFYTVDDIKDIYQFFDLSIQNLNDLNIAFEILKEEGLFR